MVHDCSDKEFGDRHLGADFDFLMTLLMTLL